MWLQYVINHYCFCYCYVTLHFWVLTNQCFRIEMYSLQLQARVSTFNAFPVVTGLRRSQGRCAVAGERVKVKPAACRRTKSDQLLLRSLCHQNMPRGVPNAKKDELGMKYTTFHAPLLYVTLHPIDACHQSREADQVAFSVRTPNSLLLATSGASHSFSGREMPLRRVGCRRMSSRFGTHSAS